MNKNSILIIGGTGFIGFHLVKSCIKKKWDITCVSTKVPTIKRRVKKVKYILADISNKNQLKKNLKVITNILSILVGMLIIKIKSKFINHIILGVKTYLKFLKIKN